MNVKLYGIPGSHPVMSARLMLEHKGIAYKRVDLFPVVSRPLVRMLGREPGHIRAVFPPAWLEPLRAATPA